MAWNVEKRPRRRRSLMSGLLGFLLLILPSVILFMGMLRNPVSQQSSLTTGIILQGILAILLLREYGPGWVLFSRSTTALYLIALGWYWFCNRNFDDWRSHLSVGLLLVVPLGLLAIQELLASGSAVMRKARFLVQKIASRKEWPMSLEDCRSVPDALTLRDLLLDDPTPALALLGHPRPHVQVCALTALQYRPKWRRAHAQILLQTAQHAVEPVVRAAALTALANVEDPILVGTLTQYLRDPMPEVRRAAAGAILWKPEKRWASVRHAVRAHLSDPRAARDGALPCLTTLPELAIRDLTIWASEIGAVGQRATLTLVSYYRRNISEEKSTGFARYLNREMLDPSVPSAVRVEVAYMLREQNRIEPECFEAMLEASQPGALRLIAAEAILARNSNPQAVEVLKEIARQPNRELALAAAVIIQKALRVDLGLPLGEAPPLPQSKQAAEIIRKVKQWASQPDLRKVDDESIDFDLPQVSSTMKR